MKAEPDRFSLTITERLNFKAIPFWLNQIVEKVINHGFQVYLVGGAVRDLLQGLTPNDWDLASDATPDKIESLFSKTIPTGKAFGTITIISDKHQVEITTLREEFHYTYGRRPEKVVFTKDIHRDLARRDFTINAMAYDFRNQILIDPFGGRGDLKLGLLKTVADPNLRFAEDGLRMFRFFRFLANLNLDADPATIRAVRPEYAKFLSYERIRDELTKTLIGKRVRIGLEGLEKTGLLSMVIPELNVKSFKNGSLNKNLWEHLIAATEAIQPELVLRLAALFHDVAKPLTYHQDQTGVHFHGHDQLGADLCRDILTRLHYPKTIIESVATLIRWHMFNITLESSDTAIRRFITKVGIDHLANLLELRRADIVATGRISYSSWQSFDDLCQRLKEQASIEPEYRQKNLAVNGHDLISNFQLIPGPTVGKILKFLHELVIENPEINNKNQLLKKAAEYLKNL